MTDHIKNCRKLRCLSKVDFMGILNNCLISDSEKEIMKRHYLKDQTFAYIADTMGYSESTVKYKHKSVIARISRYL